jgi:hypothetical protein
LGKACISFFWVNKGDYKIKINGVEVEEVNFPDEFLSNLYTTAMRGGGPKNVASIY